MATIELTLEQLVDAARQLPVEERRRLIEDVQRLPAPEQARDRARRLRGTYRMGTRARSRMAELLAKGNEGTLSDRESAELDRLVREFETKSLEMARAVVRGKSRAKSAKRGGASS